MLSVSIKAMLTFDPLVMQCNTLRYTREQPAKPTHAIQQQLRTEMHQHWALYFTAG